MTNKPKMLQPKVYKVKIILKSWLHIWAWKEALKIWWIDSSVVKHPITNEPYIPWSSLKWRMRALLEMTEYADKLESNENIWPIADPETEIAKAFGCAGDTKIASRIIFSDLYLTNEWKQKFDELKSDFYEDKYENSVPRFLSWNANPRQIERVPAGISFEWEIVLTPVENYYPISQEELEKILCKWIKLVELAWLGGGVSRWNGRVKIEIEWLDCRKYLEEKN